MLRGWAGVGTVLGGLHLGSKDMGYMYDLHLDVARCLYSLYVPTIGTVPAVFAAPGGAGTGYLQSEVPGHSQGPRRSAGRPVNHSTEHTVPAP